MNEEEIITAASYCLMKGLDYETMRYSDYMYGNEKLMDRVWDYVEEAQEDGFKAFRIKYSHVKLCAF